MNTFSLSEPLAQRLAWTLIQFLWQGFAIALMLVLTIRLGRVRRSDWRYGLSLVALIAMTASPIATFLIVNVPTPIERPGQQSPAVTTPSLFPRAIPDENKIPLDNAEAASDPGPASVTQTTPTSSAAARSIDSQPELSHQFHDSGQFSWQQVQPWIVSAWFVGVALLSGRLLLGWVGIGQIRQRGIDAPRWLVEQTQRLASELRMTGCPQLKISHRAREAIALGFLRPVILLPAAWMTQMPPDMLAAVLAHELAHIRRHDLWVNLFQRVVETLLFYHPAVWWLSRRLRIERELCCDELVVGVTRNPLRYAETLEHIGRLSLNASPAPLIVSIMGSRSMLSVRVRNILHLRSQEHSSWAWLAGVVPLLLAGVVYCSMATRGKVSAQVEEDLPDGSSIVAVKYVQVSNDNNLGATSEDNKTTASVIDTSREDTRRLTLRPSDPNVAMSIRTTTDRQIHRQRTEASGGVLVSVEVAKFRWKMRANDLLVETDAPDRPTTDSQETQLQLQADNSVLTAKTPLRMTLIGKVSVVYTSDGHRTPAEVTADKILIDFERSVLFAEKARFQSKDTILEGDRVSVSFRDDSLRVGTASKESSPPETDSIESTRQSVEAVLVRRAAEGPAVDMKTRRSQRMLANDREAARNLVGRWLLTLPSHDLIDVELAASEDGCLRLVSRKGSDFVGRYSLNGDRLELVDHESPDSDFVWQLQGPNSLKKIAERGKDGIAKLGSKLERIAADGSQVKIFQIPDGVLAQTRELAAADAKKRGSPKTRRPAGLEDLDSAEAIKRAVDRAMLLLADGEKYTDGLIQLRYLGDEAFEALVAGSTSQNVQVAKWSCSALEYRGLKAVGPLADALKSSPDSVVRSIAAGALGQTFQPTAVPALIAALDDPDPQVRVSVLNSIKYPRDPRAIEPLKRFVNDPGVGHVAASAIQHIQKSQGYMWWPVDQLDLCQLCQDAHTLTGERYRDVELNRLTTGLKSDDGSIRYCCLFALGRLGSKESVPAIIQAPLGEMKFKVLAEIATPDAIEYLIQRLHSLNPQTRELAIHGLANGADRWAALPLIALLDDPALKVEARKMEFPGRSSNDAWPESHQAHTALYSLFSRFGLKGEWRNLYANQTNNVPEEITNLKVWWKLHGVDFIAGKQVPNPNLSTVFYNDP